MSDVNNNEKEIVFSNNDLPQPTSDLNEIDLSDSNNSDVENVEDQNQDQEIVLSNNNSDPNSNEDNQEIEISDTNNESESKDNKEEDIQLSSNTNTNANANSNNSNIESIDLFNNANVIEVENVEEIPEHEREYTDQVYRQLLQNELFSELPIEKQNSKLFQTQVITLVEKLLDLKKIGEERVKQPKGYNPMRQGAVDGQFPTGHLYPIVYNKKVIYRITKTDENNDEVENSFDVRLYGDPEGYIVENQVDVFMKEQELGYKFKRDEIKYDQYYQELNELLAPYKEANKKIGYTLTATHDQPALRYFNLDSYKWEQYVNSAPFETSYEVIDPYSKKRSTVRKTIVAGDRYTVVGFYLNRKNKDSLLTSLIGEPTNKWSKFGKAATITKIEQSGAKLMITAPNHNLVNRQKVYLSNTNCFPQIDGVFKDKIEVIDNDQFTVPGQLVKAGDTGQVFSTLKLDVERYDAELGTDNTLKLTKNGKKADIETIWRNTTPAVIMFDKEKLSREEYIALVYALIPDYKAIIENELHCIDHDTNLQKINKYFQDNYNLSIYDVNISCIAQLKDRIKERIEEEEKEAAKEKEERSKQKYTPRKVEYSPVFADEYLKNKVVEKLYGQYPHFGKDSDGDVSRFKWINSQPDHGAIYLIIVAIENYAKDSKTEMDKLAKSFKDEQKTVEKKITQEQKAKQYFKECGKYKVQYSSIEKLKEDQTKYEAGDIAIIQTVDNKGARIISENDGKLFRWENGWKELSDSYFSSIQQLCDLNTTDLKKLSIDKLICMYNDRCKPKKLDLLENRMNRIDNALETLTTMLDSVSDEKLKDQYQRLLKAYHFLTFKSPEKGDDETIPDEHGPLLTTELTNKIDRVKRAQLRAYLIYALIRKDGLTIGDYIYSKKWKEPMLCGHWNYLMWSEEATNSVIKGNLYQKMLDKFGDDGQVEIGFQTCRVCGRHLNIVDYDESEGLNQLGERRVTRETYQSAVIDTKQLLERERALFDTYKTINCADNNFKTTILNAGVSAEKLPDAYKVCETLNSISDKIGVSIRSTDFMKIIIDTVNRHRLPVSEIKHKREEWVKLKEKKGLDTYKLNQLDSRGYFKDSYNRYLLNNENKLNILLAMRILISLQTANPPYIVGKILVPCSFRGYEGEHGIEFMACVLRKMGIVYEYFKTELGKVQLRPLSESKTIENCWYNYKKFREDPQIGVLFMKKREKVVEKKKIEIVVDNKFGENVKIESDFMEQVKQSKKTTTEYEKFLARRRYLERQLINSIFEIVHSAEVDMMNPEIMSVSMGACCVAPVNEDTYDFYNKISDNKTNKLREQLNKFAEYSKLFLQKGSITYNVGDSGKWYLTSNDGSLIQRDPSNTIILEKFMTYCSEGVTRGQLHVFNKEGRCFKCEQSKKEIRETNYTLNQYFDLLKTIRSITSKPLARDVELEKLKDFDTIRYECTDNYDRLVTQFVNKLSKLLRKDNDPEFVGKYLSAIENLGFYKNELEELKNNIHEDNEKKQIQAFELIQKQRVQNIKSYINDYFRKYISIIANQHKTKRYLNINGMNQEKSTQIQMEIFGDQEKFDFFLDNNYSAIFKKLKFDFSSNEINKVNGYPTVYNYNYSKVLKQSPFTYSYASNMLIYMLIVQLNGFLDIDFVSTTNTEEMDIKDNVAAYRIVATFIEKIFDIINDESEIYNMSETNYNKFLDSMKQEQRKHMESALEKAGSAPQEQLNVEQIEQFDYGDFEGKTTIDIAKEQEMEDEVLTDRAKSDLKSQLGRDATANEIEQYKESFEHEQEVADEEYHDNFNMFQPKEGLNVMEVGDDYGEMQQGTENEGDGFNDFTQAELFGSN